MTFVQMLGCFLSDIELRIADDFAEGFTFSAILKQS